MPNTVDELRQRMEQLRSEGRRLAEDQRKVIQEYDELRDELRALLEQEPKAS